jgi:hypothetical protein
VQCVTEGSLPTLYLDLRYLGQDGPDNPRSDDWQPMARYRK